MNLRPKKWTQVHNSLIITLVIIATTTHALTPPRAVRDFNNTNCASSAIIDPCECYTDFFTGTFHTTLDCDDTAGDHQETINRAFMAMHAVNAGDRLELYRFMTGGTLNPTSLDLTPLAKTDFHTFDISFTNLDTLIGATNSTDEIDIGPHRFSVVSVDVWGSNFKDADATQLLKFIEPDKLIAFTMAESALTMVPDVTPFKNLWSVAVAYNQIKEVTTDHFRGQSYLKELVLANNQISRIHENAFTIDNPVIGDASESFDFRLYNNELTDDLIHENHGMDSFGVATKLNLAGNRFEFISEVKFEKFLQAHPNNYLYMGDNNIVCDDRSSWLKRKRDEYEPRVWGMECVNDPGNTVFNSSLVS